MAGGLARVRMGARPSWWLFESERPSRVRVVSDRAGERGRDRGRSLENLGERGREGEVGRVREREGERGRRGEERGSSLGSFTTGERGRSLAGHTLYLSVNHEESNQITLTTWRTWRIDTDPRQLKETKI